MSQRGRQQRRVDTVRPITMAAHGRFAANSMQNSPPETGRVKSSCRQFSPDPLTERVKDLVTNKVPVRVIGTRLKLIDVQASRDDIDISARQARGNLSPPSASHQIIACSSSVQRVASHRYKSFRSTEVSHTIGREEPKPGKLPMLNGCLRFEVSNLHQCSVSLTKVPLVAARSRIPHSLSHAGNQHRVCRDPH